jgi:hypothetical protein
METLIDLFELQHRPAIETYRSRAHRVEALVDEAVTAHLARADRDSARWNRARLWSSED